MGKKRDLTGQRFGKLLVVEDTGNLQDRYALWKCRCDCGGEALVNTKRLLRGTVRDCGCVPRTTMRNGSIPADLTGMRFGSLVALRPAPKRGEKSCWFCRCDCGREYIAATHELRRGKTKSCGCRAHLPGTTIADLKGRQFGRLTAVSATTQRDGKGSVIWKCRCACGSDAYVSQDGLVYGNYKSCGCLKREQNEKIGEYLHFVDGTCVEWLDQRKHRSDNTSGFRGVSALANGKYRVGIGFKRKRYYVGTYSSYEKAVQARLEVEELIHGQFLELYRQWSLHAEADSHWAEQHPLVFDVEKNNGTFQVIQNTMAEMMGG